MRNFSYHRLWFVAMACVLIGILAACANSGEETSTPSSSTTNESGGSSEAQPIELKLVSALATNSVNAEVANALARIAEEKGNGKVKINLLGGPEVIPPFELGEAVKNGSVDMAFLPGGYYTSVVPEAEVLTYSEYSFDEEKENGAWDFLNQIHLEKGNMHLLHVQRGALHYNIFTKKPVSSLDDFKGFRLRVAPSHIPFATAVGADIINIEISEVYTSLERGIVDGFAFVDAGITNFGFEEQINHYITPYIYEGDTSLIVNRNVWESLPQDVQELLLEWSKEAEAQYIAAVEEVRNQELEKFKELGITEINLGDELQQVALEAGWSHLQETSPENYEKLRELFTKQ